MLLNGGGGVSVAPKYNVPSIIFAKNNLVV